MIERINEAMTLMETGFNIAGSIPYVSVVSGILRALVGKIQCIAGTIFAAIGFIGQIVDSENSKKWEKITEFGMEHTMHGALNVIRGVGESFLGCTGVGSLALLAFQLLTEDGFRPRFKYEGQGSYASLISIQIT